MALRPIISIALAIASLAGCAHRIVSDWRSQVPSPEVLLAERRGPRDIPTGDEALDAARGILATTERACGMPWPVNDGPSSAIPYSSLIVTQAEVVAWAFDWPEYEGEALDSTEVDEVLIAARAVRPESPEVFIVLMSLFSYGRVGQPRQWRLTWDSWNMNPYAEAGSIKGIKYARFPSIDCLEPDALFNEIPVGGWQGMPSGWVTARTRLVGFDEAAWLRYFEALPSFGS
jgi:hypothetical protein